MLLVPTLTGPSKVHGIGLFAAEPIKKGTPIWQLSLYFCDQIVPPPNLLPDEFSRFVAEYAYFDKFQEKWILCGDDAPFMNHVATPEINTITRQPKAGDTPTVEARIMKGERGKSYEFAFAACDIEAKKELTIDYRQFDAKWGSGTKPEREFTNTIPDVTQAPGIGESKPTMES